MPHNPLIKILSVIVVVFVMNGCIPFQDRPRIENYTLLNPTASSEQPRCFVSCSSTRKAFVLDCSHIDMPDSVWISSPLIQKKFKSEPIALLQDSVYGARSLNRIIKESNKDFYSTYINDTITMKVFKHGKAMRLVYVRVTP